MHVFVLWSSHRYTQVPAGVVLIPKLKLGNAVLEAPASSLAKLELRLRGSQAGAWEPEETRKGVANLVLACTDCNRGVNGKFAHLPALPLLQRLHDRNEYLITSHHPLRETLIVQTGCSTEKRQQFLQDAYNCSITHYGFNQKWQPPQQGIAIF